MTVPSSANRAMPSVRVLRSQLPVRTVPPLSTIAGPPPMVWASGLRRSTGLGLYGVSRMTTFAAFNCCPSLASSWLRPFVERQ